MRHRILAGTRRLHLMGLLLALTLTACDDSGSGPDTSLEAVAGLYTAESGFGVLSLTTEADGETTDWLAAGADLQLDLKADGTVAGRLFIPDAGEDGEDMDEDMAGTWTLTGNTVQLDQDADTFLRDMPLTLTDGVLTGDRSFGGVRVRVVLVKS